MNWGKLTIAVLIIYATYYSVQIGIELIRESKKKKPITEGDDYEFVEEKPVEVNEIELFDHQEVLAPAAGRLPDHNNRKQDTSQKIIEPDTDFNIHPIYGEPINMEEIKRKTNIISEAIFGKVGS